MLTYVPNNAQHIGAREEQQDSFAFSDPGNADFVAHGGLLGVIADGMGGLAGGREASSVAVRTFLHSYSRKTRQESISAALRRSMADANTAVLNVARRIQSGEGTGTTLIGMVTHDATLHWISAGDSRLYIFRQGSLARVNEDHNYGTELLVEVAADRTGRTQAIEDSRASHLTSYLGLPDLPKLDRSIRPFPLQSSDVLLACTDGVYRSLSETEIMRLLSDEVTGPVCEALVKAVLNKKKLHQDNLTAISVQCKGEVKPLVQTNRKTPSWLSIALCLELVAGGALAARFVHQHTSHAMTAKQKMKPVPGSSAPTAVIPKPVTETTNKGATRTSISRSTVPTSVGQSLTLTATVTSLAELSPTGSVVFKNGDEVLKIVPLVYGKASLTMANPPTGTDSIIAHYSGDTKNASSSSAGLAQESPTRNTSPRAGATLPIPAPIPQKHSNH